MHFIFAACVLLLSLSAVPVSAQYFLAGSLAGQFEVSPVGSPQYSIPLELPPGIAGMEPKLALAYESGITNGPFGPGWSIQGLSAITRCAATIDQDGQVGSLSLTYDDRFCLDWQRLVSLNGGNSTEYRTRGAFI